MTYKLVIDPVLGKKYIHPFFSTKDIERAKIRKSIILRDRYVSCKGVYEAVNTVNIVEFND